jgi:hypothetical protein
MKWSTKPRKEGRAFTCFALPRAVVALIVTTCGWQMNLAAADGHWVTTWGCAPQLTEPGNLPPAPLGHNTLRQIDFDAVVRDPVTLTDLQAAFYPGVNANDWLHLNPAGYKAMGDAIYLNLFGPWKDRKRQVAEGCRGARAVLWRYFRAALFPSGSEDINSSSVNCGVSTPAGNGRLEKVWK